MLVYLTSNLKFLGFLGILGSFGLVGVLTYFFNLYCWYANNTESWFTTVKTLARKAIDEQKPVYFKILHKKYKIVCDESLKTELDINWRPKLLTKTFSSLLPDSFFVQNFKIHPEARNEKRLLVKTVSDNIENFNVIKAFIDKNTQTGIVDMLEWTNNILYGVIGKLVMGIEYIPPKLNIADVVNRVSLMANEIMKNELLWALPHKQYEIYKLKKEVYNTTYKLFKINKKTLNKTKYIKSMADLYKTSIYSAKVINKTGVPVFLAAENTISLILYCYWKLLTNEDIHIKLKNTLSEELTYDTIMSNTYLDNIIDETLRFYPLVPMVLRYSKNKENIIIPIMDIHHSSKFYSHPESFRPEHFSPEESSKRPKHAFIPFGWGSRSCAGRNIGKLIGKVVIAYLVKNIDAKMITTPKLYNDMLNKIEYGWTVSMEKKKKFD